MSGICSYEVLKTGNSKWGVVRSHADTRIGNVVIFESYRERCEDWVELFRECLQPSQIFETPLGDYLLDIADKLGIMCEQCRFTPPTERVQHDEEKSDADLEKVDARSSGSVVSGEEGGV